MTVNSISTPLINKPWFTTFTHTLMFSFGPFSGLQYVCLYINKCACISVCVCIPFGYSILLIYWYCVIANHHQINNVELLQCYLKTAILHTK